MREFSAPRRAHKIREQPLRQRVARHSLRVPLHSEDKVGVGVLRPLAALDGLDNGVLWAACADVQAIAGLARRVIAAGREATGRRDIRCTVSIGGTSIAVGTR